MTTFTRDSVVPGYEAGFRSALGLSYTPEDHVVVIGKTSDEKIALKNAEQIEKLFKSTGTTDMKVHVIKASGGDTFYLSVGDFSPAAKAAKTQDQLKDVAIKALTESTLTQQEKQSAKILLNGDISSKASRFLRNSHSLHKAPNQVRAGV